MTNGGIGSLLGEVIAESGAACRLGRIAVDRPYGGRGGSEAFLHETHGLSVAALSNVSANLRDGVRALKTESFRPVSNTPPETVAGKAKFYGRMFLDLQVWTVYRDLRRHLPHFRGEVLDVGCGQSPYRYLLDSRTTRYIGIDILAADRFGYANDEIVPFDGEHIPFPDEKFDAVFCTEVLEHVADFQGLVDEIFRVLKRRRGGDGHGPVVGPLDYVPYDYFRYTPSSLALCSPVLGVTDYAPWTDVSVIASKLVRALGCGTCCRTALACLRAGLGACEPDWLSARDRVRVHGRLHRL